MMKMRVAKAGYRGYIGYRVYEDGVYKEEMENFHSTGWQPLSPDSSKQDALDHVQNLTRPIHVTIPWAHLS